ncbi:MAG: alpha/beta hydrolase family protein [Bdellovibrionales bacterium]
MTKCLAALLATVVVSSSAIADVLMEATPFHGSKLYRPADPGPHPAVIVLHGSEGGSLPYYELEAQYLAANGFVALAFCWYNCGKSPITGRYSPLENVELEKTLDAIKWLKSHPSVNGQKVGVEGFSRGAEQALVLGGLNEAIAALDAIAAHAGSDTVVSGFTWAAQDKRCWICVNFDLACFRDTDQMKYWDWDRIKWNPSCGAYPKHPDHVVIPSWLWRGTPMTLGSRIEIEKFGKPVFLSVGNRDEVWDYKKTIRVGETLGAHGKPYEIHVFSGEHHNFSPANENIRHERLVKFLKASLGGN